jgi:hypothetical protein
LFIHPPHKKFLYRFLLCPGQEEPSKKREAEIGQPFPASAAAAEGYLFPHPLPSKFHHSMRSFLQIHNREQRVAIKIERLKKKAPGKRRILPPEAF